MINKVLIEELAINDELNVRGFIDLVVQTDDGGVYLYDIKSINAWSYRMKFGTKREKNGSIHQELQVATYGLWVKENLGRLDGMYLLYYNKDTSMMQTLDVDMSRLETAKTYWKQVNELHSEGLPPLMANQSPIMDWECRYCNFTTQCDDDVREGK